jgi:hypothetical protein
MPGGKGPSRLLTVLCLLLSAAGLAAGVWVATSAHEFFHPNALHTVVHGPKDRFLASRPGRYELSYKEELGDLTFQVVSEKTGASVPVEEFDFLTHIGHTRGYRGFAFQIDTPGHYQVSVQPWQQGYEVELGYVNTWALSRRVLAGLVLGAVGFVVPLGVLARIRKRSKQGPATAPD